MQVVCCNHVVRSGSGFPGTPDREVTSPTNCRRSSALGLAAS